MQSAPAPGTAAPTRPLWRDDRIGRGDRPAGTGSGTPTASPAREALPSQLDADLCVVGLGAAGLQAATTASRRGLGVVGLDAGAIGDGASGRNGGFLLAGAADFHHRLGQRVGRARAAALYERTLEELETQIRLTPEAVRRVGSIRLATSDEELDDCAAQAAVMRRDRLPVDEADGPFGRGLFFPRDAAMHPGRRMELLHRMAAAAGVRLVAHAPVHHLDTGTVVSTAVRVTAPYVLVAVDGGLEAVVPELAGHVRTARAQMLATAPNAVAPELVPAPVYARYGLDYWQRLEDGRVALGGARDVGGHEEWTSTDAVTPRVQSALEHILRQRLGSGSPITHRWSGRLGFTADRLPVCAVVRPGVAVAGGYCGTGNVLGALTARAALALLLDGWSADAELLRLP